MRQSIPWAHPKDFIHLCPHKHQERNLVSAQDPGHGYKRVRRHDEGRCRPDEDNQRSSRHKAVEGIHGHPAEPVLAGLGGACVIATALPDLPQAGVHAGGHQRAAVRQEKPESGPLHVLGRSAFSLIARSKAEASACVECTVSASVKRSQSPLAFLTREWLGLETFVERLVHSDVLIVADYRIGRA